MKSNVFLNKLHEQIDLFLQHKISACEFAAKYKSLGDKRKKSVAYFLSKAELELEDVVRRYKFNSPPTQEEREKGLKSIESVLKYRVKQIKNNTLY